jgi:hypothetical protein
MTTIEEQMQRDLIGPGADQAPAVAGPEVQSQKIGINLEWLKAQTGEGDISDYIDHPLNFKKSEGLAQILRGVSGFAGHNLKYALIDILIGAFKFRSELKG